MDNYQSSTFKLAKVEAYNQTAALADKIIYRAYVKHLPGGQRALDFTFFGLSPIECAKVDAVYGHLSHVRPLRPRGDYTLADFMPPMVQALINHRFEHVQAEIEEINENRNGKWDFSPDGNISTSVKTSINCWATAYNAIQGFHAEASAPNKFTVFLRAVFRPTISFLRWELKLDARSLPRASVRFCQKKFQLKLATSSCFIPNGSS